MAQSVQETAMHTANPPTMTTDHTETTPSRQEALLPLPPGVTLSPGNQSASPESSPTPRTGDQWAVLAGLRFVLAVVVMVGHLDLYGKGPDALRWISNFSAYQAVFVFFVISGFSITHSITREPGGFYLRRYNRIYPVYFVGLVAACLIFAWFGPAFLAGTHLVEAPKTIWPTLESFFMLQGIATGHPMIDYGQSWSLSVECVCYLLAPFLCRMRSRWLIAIFAFSITMYVKRWVFGPYQNPMNTIAGFGAVMCLWAWIAGVLVYRHRDNWMCNWSITAAMAYAMGSLDGSGTPFSPAYLVASMALVTHANRIKLAPWLRSAALYGGDLSLCVYLTHTQVYCVLLHLHPDISPYVCIASALAVGTATLHIVDRPYQAYARRESRRARASVHVA